MPLPQSDDFLQSSGDTAGRPLAARALDLLEAYLEGHPPTRYDTQQEAWFGLFLDGRGIGLEEKQEILAIARRYREFLGESHPPADPAEGSAPSQPASTELKNRFKPGPSVGPPPRPGWKKKVQAAGKRTSPAGTARPPAAGASLLAMAGIAAAILWAAYWIFVTRPLGDFEHDLGEKLRRNQSNTRPAYGAWVMAEAERRGLEIIPERSAIRVLGVREYLLDSSPMHKVEFRAGVRLPLPLGLHWNRTVTVTTETYHVPSDWPPKSASPQPRTNIPAKAPRRKDAIPRQPYETILAALAGARSSVLAFYEENPEETGRLLETELRRLNEGFAALPAAGSPDEQLVRDDLKTSIERIRSMSIVISQAREGLLTSRQLRQSIDTLVAQSEMHQRKAEVRLGN